MVDNILTALHALGLGLALGLAVAFLVFGLVWGVAIVKDYRRLRGLKREDEAVWAARAARAAEAQLKEGEHVHTQNSFNIQIEDSGVPIRSRFYGLNGEDK